jgi:hypothetical protein
MPKLTITRNEWHPVLMLDEESIFEQSEVPQALVDRYEAALAEWEAVQAELRLIAPEDED